MTTERPSPSAGGHARHVLLIVGGGIAAYKALFLVRLLRADGIGVTPVLTRGGAQFITPLSLASLAGTKCYQDLFDLTDEAEMGHIELSRSANLVAVVPATADLMAKAANGHADDLASTILLATDKRVLMAPAMNVRMWEHPAVRRNTDRLRADGVLFAEPEEGPMACGEYGRGRLAEPETILQAILGALGGSASEANRPAASPGQSMAGRRALVTAGPTHEPLDPVRFLGNRSSGKQGYAIAEALVAAGAEVTLVSGPTALPDPSGMNVIRVETARQMMAACDAALPVDAAICCAAVADYRPEVETSHKVKKERGGLTAISLVENPDILAALSRPGKRRPPLVVGFAAETDDILGHAEAKRRRKECDWIVANDVTPGTGSMGGDRNTVILLTDDGPEAWEDLPKSEVAHRLVARMAAFLTGDNGRGR